MHQKSPNTKLINDWFIHKNIFYSEYQMVVDRTTKFADTKNVCKPLEI